MQKYIPANIEPKWQKKWKEEGLYLTNLSDTAKKYYVLVELPYTSGDLHMGHWFTFTMGDILARFKKRLGFNVLFPNGFDAFGLPAENAAIKHGIHPRDWTYQNMERMREQFETLGTSIDWTKTMVACDPKYYKWNQWIFLKMLEKGLAYQGKLLSNWCPVDQTVLANENVEDGKCWRCGAGVVQKEVIQWFFKITALADKLIWQDPPQADWPKHLREGQNNWIGKSEGMILDFDRIKVFTTRPQTSDGATFLVLAPEHPLVSKLTTKEQKNDVESYIKSVKSRSELERKESKEKTGEFSGSFVKNPVSGRQIPVWIADYVLMGYGTGAIMAVPYADERDKQFAEQFKLPIIKTSFKAKPSGQKQTQYHLHDWSISRQRYWGTPIPIIYCDKCGVVPVPEKDLPVELPYKVDYAPQGKPPLATAEDWVRVECPKCGGPAKREVETMDTFVDSAWYFFRYLDNENDEEIFDKKIVADWMPLEIYIGGPEHTLGHALYSRFFTMVFKSLGLIKFDEYAKKRIHHGTILGPGGLRMSKSRGNVVNPDKEVKSYGADAIRLYLMFLGPYDIVTPWKTEGVNGIYHFLQRVWGLQEKAGVDSLSLRDHEDMRMMHRTIKKVTEDLVELKFNTAIAALMEWLNHLSRKEQVSKEEYKTYLCLLAPFAPHITEELWQNVILRSASDEGSLTNVSSNELRDSSLIAQNDEFQSIHQQPWPQFNDKYLAEEKVKVVVQINGKVRDVLLIQKDIINHKEVIEKMAFNSPKSQKFLKGKLVKKSVYIPSKIISFVV
ncbi:leucine--tRNA ligase [Candidatus Daviesbacteria bacterium]|nr:leucine--tRNA ligase [Candidatus Daviesbacteria bacterium]